ncbi:YfaP family protein [Edaphovirga cremea]|uniref:YfaP family protein n=1 Tax=Edaphovirga cremea TaxID=2267246 RepID=UPI00398991BB
MIIRRLCDICSLLLMVATTSVLAEQRVDIDTPLAGWHDTSGEGADFSQQVNYPASSINSPVTQAAQALIKGQIKGFPKQSSKAKQEPGRLIVNGVSMPLKIQENGSFSRPYIFPQGSNSVEVRSPDRTATHRTQFYAQRGNGAIPARLRVVLSWDTDNTDLDLHVVTPEGGHAWYGGRQLASGGALDVDVTTGFGPEIFSSPVPESGQYLLFVNYYGGRGEEILTTAQITIVTEEGTGNEKHETVIVPMRNPGELTLVKKFSYSDRG